MGGLVDQFWFDAATPSTPSTVVVTNVGSPRRAGSRAKSSASTRVVADTRTGAESRRHPPDPWRRARSGRRRPATLRRGQPALRRPGAGVSAVEGHVVLLSDRCRGGVPAGQRQARTARMRVASAMSAAARSAGTRRPDCCCEDLADQPQRLAGQRQRPVGQPVHDRRDRRGVAAGRGDAGEGDEEPGELLAGAAHRDREGAQSPSPRRRRRPCRSPSSSRSRRCPRRRMSRSPSRCRRRSPWRRSSPGTRRADRVDGDRGRQLQDGG